MDYRDAIIDALDTLRKRDLANKEPFKARAYQNVISQIKQLAHPIQSEADLAGITGMGEQISKKLKEIFATGQLKTAEKAKELYHMDALDAFQKIYGVGPAKATQLVEQGYRTIADLRTDPKAPLNDKQIIGLKYYEALLYRIPREEMLEHEDILKHYIKNAELVGSFRRRAETSGDIDVLIRVPTDTTPKEAKKQLAELVQRLKESKYIIEVLALGEHKCMAICRTAESAMPRRLDLLMIPEHQYGSALLYFTGSDRFNVSFRQHALHKGYTLNEYGLTQVNAEVRAVPALTSEKDLFHFLGLEYVEPWERTTMLLKLKVRPPIINVAAK